MVGVGKGDFAKVGNLPTQRLLRLRVQFHKAVKQTIICWTNLFAKLSLLSTLQHCKLHVILAGNLFMFYISTIFAVLSMFLCLQAL